MTARGPRPRALITGLGRAVPPLALVTALVGAPAAAHARPAASALVSAPGFQVVSFQLEEGTIYVNVPDDLGPGDTASGTVNPLPAGPDAKAEAKQRKTLHRYSIDLAGQRAPVSTRVRTFVVPKGATALVVALFDERHRRAGEVEVPLHPVPPPGSGYELPPRGQSGGPVRVLGPFDGDLSNSSVRIDGQDAEPIAESPRQLVVRGPREATAGATAEVRERGATVTTGTYRNVDVRLSAGATTLHSGQGTTLTITVAGVEGLKETLPVVLTNRSPEVVRVEGGEEQTLCVRPDDVGTDGTWTARRGLTGVRLGAFAIGTEVAQPRPHAEAWARAGVRLQGELRAGLVLEREGRSPSGEPLPAGPYAVVVRGAGENGEVHLLLGRQGQLVGTLPGAVFRRVRSATLCDRGDASDAVAQARVGTGDQSFQDLGFEDDEAFAVKAGEGRPRLVLTTAEEEFSIEAEVPSPQRP